MTVVSVHPARRCTSPLGVVPAGLGDGVDHGVGHCHDVAELPRVCLFISPVGILVAKWVSTSCCNDAYSVGTLNGHFGEIPGKSIMRPLFFPFWTFLFGKQKNLFFSWGVICWMVHIGRARHPGPGPRDSWLTSGDSAMDSCTHFLAFAEHRLIPSRARSICHQLRLAGHHSMRAPACQDNIPGVICLGGALLSFPSFATPHFQEFFRLGRVLRTTLPTAQGGEVFFFFE